jgi:hypothetical protein
MLAFQLWFIYEGGYRVGDVKAHENVAERLLMPSENGVVDFYGHTGNHICMATSLHQAYIQIYAHIDVLAALRSATHENVAAHVAPDARYRKWVPIPSKSCEWAPGTYLSTVGQGATPSQQYAKIKKV